jgi:hypothetical protein
MSVANLQSGSMQGHVPWQCELCLSSQSIISFSKKKKNVHKEMQSSNIKEWLGASKNTIQFEKIYVLLRLSPAIHLQIN